MPDPINPDYYVADDGVQHYELAQWMPYLLAQASKYLMRAGKKESYQQDLMKAKWYLEKFRAQLRMKQPDIPNLAKLSTPHNILIITAFGALCQGDTGHAERVISDLEQDCERRIGGGIG